MITLRDIFIFNLPSCLTQTVPSARSLILIIPSLSKESILSFTLSYDTVNGIDVISSSHVDGFSIMSIVALIVIFPLPDVLISRSSSLSTISQPVGKSGAIVIGALGSSMRAFTVSTMSLQLYGGIDAENPLPIPDVPLTRILGNLLGK